MRGHGEESREWSERLWNKVHLRLNLQVLHTYAFHINGSSPDHCSSHHYSPHHCSLYHCTSRLSTSLLSTSQLHRGNLLPFLFAPCIPAAVGLHQQKDISQ